MTLHSDKNLVITRREFLALSRAALTGLLVLPGKQFQWFQEKPDKQILRHAYQATLKTGTWAANESQDELPYIQGRVIDPYIEVYNEPDFEATTTNFLWKDSVIPILSVYFNANTESHNQVWYQISENEFVHSAAVQPVNTLPNEPSDDIPPGGRLAEVTVPFTDAYWEMGMSQPLAYRLYYQTTHWVVQLLYDQTGEPWYTVIEDKWELVYYVPARHLRLLPEEELKPLSPDIPNVFKRLEVHLAQQILIAYEQDRPIFMSRVATGGKFRDGNFSTQPGHYLTFHKRPSRHMAAGNLAAGGYDLPGVPWISYFTESGVSIHGTYWHNNFGRPRSHGCINMTPSAARWIYWWTLPLVPSHEKMAYKNYGTSLDIVSE